MLPVSVKPNKLYFDAPPEHSHPTELAKLCQTSSAIKQKNL